MPDPTPIRDDIADQEQELASRLVQDLAARGIGGERPWEPFLVHARPDAAGVERGIWLQAKPIPVHLALELETRHPEPQPPTIEVRDPETGELRRTEPNPNDPAYQLAHEAWRERVKIDQQKTILAVGIDVLFADEGFDMPDDDGWAESVELAGVPVAARGTRQRQLDYLRYYALQSTIDLGKAVYRGLLMVGTPELEVARAAGLNFRDPSRRAAHLRRAAETG